MALIDPITLQPKSYTTLEATFTGTAYLFVDGFFVAGPETSSADLPFPSNQPLAIEGHDANVDPINLKPFIHPSIFWRPRASSDRYRVYHTPPGGSESMIYERDHSGEIDRYEFRFQDDLIEGWHFFRVEAVTIDDIESTVEARPVYAYDIPPLVSDLAIAGGAGSFNFTITP